MIAFAPPIMVTRIDGPMPGKLPIDEARQWLAYAMGVPRATLVRRPNTVARDAVVIAYRAVAAWLLRYHGPGGLRSWAEVSETLGHTRIEHDPPGALAKHWPRYPAPDSSALALACRFHGAWNNVPLPCVSGLMAMEAYGELRRMASGKEANPWNGKRLARASA